MPIHLSSGFFLTRNLKALLEVYQSTLPVADFESFQKYVNTLIGQTIADLGQFSPGINRGRRVHELLEAEIQKASHIPTSCKMGCGSCCHYEVEVTADDAEILAAVVLEGRVKIDRTRLARLALREKQDQSWKRGVVPDNRCVFLSEGNSCGIYNDRPAACRKLSVTTPASHCADLSKKTEPLLMPVAEIILSAALSCKGNSFAAMAKMLDRRLSHEIDQDEMASLENFETPELALVPTRISPISS
jgi:uncharacterized protein